jgi:acyl carrier protein
MKQRIITILSDALPLVDLKSDFLFAELSSLDITTIMMLLSDEYHITLDAHDATPKNFRNIDAIVAMVEKKFADNK